MRIQDMETGKRLQNVCIYLTDREIEEMKCVLEDFFTGALDHHAHINDDSYKHEVTIAVYNDENFDQFDERSKRLILEDR
jgi:hypothetical protein